MQIKFVQIGRVCYISEGKYIGNLCTIINIIDENTVLADVSTLTKLNRIKLKLRILHLTKHVVTGIGYTSSKQDVQNKFNEQKISQQFYETKWGKQIISDRTKTMMGDYDRFIVQTAKKK
ncbi:60S ribosomal protein L14, partial [Intoshia linei]